MKILAVIPARGGSKRLPRKNAMPLANKPLLAYSIEAALNSSQLNEVVVSTDDQELADISAQYHCPTPFLRPPHLASDTAGSVEVVLHALDFYEKELQQTFDYVLLLQPTSPLRTSQDIDAAIQLMKEQNADAIISMCACEHSPLWSNTLGDDGNINEFDRAETLNLRSQDLPTYYRYNGAIYLSKVDRFRKEGRFNFNTKSYAYLMSTARSVDIDQEIDFKLAEVLLNEK